MPDEPTPPPHASAPLPSLPPASPPEPDSREFPPGAAVGNPPEAAVADPEASSTTHRSEWKTWVVAGVVAAVVAGGIGLVMTRNDHAKAATGNVAADTNQSGTGATNRIGRRGAFGTIKAIEGSTITVSGTDREGTTTTSTVETTDQTRFTETVDGKLRDITKGDEVTALAESSDSTTATRVIDSGPGSTEDDRDTEGFPGGPGGFGGSPLSIPDDAQLNQAPPDLNGNGAGGPRPNLANITRGTVTAVDGSVITVKRTDGTTATITTDASTAFTVTKTIALADLKVGDHVSANGDVDGATVTATSVRRGDLPTGGFGPGGGFQPGNAPSPGRDTGNSGTGS